MLVSGVPERVDYAPLSGVEILFPSAQLKLCDIPCNINRVSSRLTLSTSHIGKGCDRDTYSVQSQRKICGTLREFQFIYYSSTFEFLIQKSNFSSLRHLRLGSLFGYSIFLEQVVQIFVKAKDGQENIFFTFYFIFLKRIFSYFEIFK